MKFDAQLYSDLYKEVYGARPHNYTPLRTEDELDAMMTALWETQSANEARERERELSCLRDFDAEIDMYCDYGAPTRGVAVRWMFQAWAEENYDYDPEAFLLQSGIPFKWMMHYKEFLI